MEAAALQGTPRLPPRRSVALGLLLVLRPNGLAVLQGHLFIVAPGTKETSATRTLGTASLQRHAILTRSQLHSLHFHHQLPVPAPHPPHQGRHPESTAFLWSPLAGVLGKRNPFPSQPEQRGSRAT